MKNTRTKRVGTKQANEVDLLVRNYLKKNPEVRKSLDVFKISRSEYTKSIEAKMPMQVISSKNTMVNNGDMARD